MASLLEADGSADFVLRRADMGKNLLRGYQLSSDKSEFIRSCLDTGSSAPVEYIASCSQYLRQTVLFTGALKGRLFAILLWGPAAVANGRIIKLFNYKTADLVIAQYLSIYAHIERPHELK